MTEAKTLMPHLWEHAHLMAPLHHPKTDAPMVLLSDSVTMWHPVIRCIYAVALTDMNFLIPQLNVPLPTSVFKTAKIPPIQLNISALVQLIGLTWTPIVKV